MVQFSPRLLRVRPAGESALEVAVHGSGSYDAGPVRVDLDLDDDALRWSVYARGSGAVALDAVGVVFDAGPPGDSPLMFVQGYQSWSPTRTMRLGVDRDPSCDAKVPTLIRATFHADPSVAAEDELRSEQVTVLALDGPELGCIGFAGGDRHAGTLRARIAGGRVEVCAEAWLGGALTPNDRPRVLHDITYTRGESADALLEEWAARVGAANGARVGAPFVVGWCSWYHYFHDVTEQAMRDNLARAGDWPFDVFQLDDGFQQAIGDWLMTNDKFPAGVDGIAAAVRAAGQVPGIWLAPFLAAPDSALADRHPEWLARATRRKGFATGWFNEPWGGVMAVVDTTRADVLEHLEATARSLVDAGYRYLKLDFTFSAAMPGRYADPTRTPAERVRAGYDAIRRGAGDDVFVLGCGAPIGAVVGAVDGMRIGADVAPCWDLAPGAAEGLAGYTLTVPATHHAFVNTCTRSFMHRRLWSNDPDCIMLRTRDTQLSRAAAEGWARTVGASGGLVLVSDDLALLGVEERRLLDEVAHAGRVADAGAQAGAPPRPLGLFDPGGPVGIAGAGGRVELDTATGSLLS